MTERQTFFIVKEMVSISLKNKAQECYSVRKGRVIRTFSTTEGQNCTMKNGNNTFIEDSNQIIIEVYKIDILRGYTSIT